MKRLPAYFYTWKYIKKTRGEMEIYLYVYTCMGKLGCLTWYGNWEQLEATKLLLF